MQWSAQLIAMQFPNDISILIDINQFFLGVQITRFKRLSAKVLLNTVSVFLLNIFTVFSTLLLFFNFFALFQHFCSFFPFTIGDASKIRELSENERKIAYFQNNKNLIEQQFEWRISVTLFLCMISSRNSKKIIIIDVER